jgi:hypothetical protein
MIDTLSYITKTISDFIFEHEDSFLERFCAVDAWALTELTYYDKGIKFTYVVDTGEHICDTLDWSEYNDFIESLKEKDYEY